MIQKEFLHYPVYLLIRPKKPTGHIFYAMFGYNNRDLVNEPFTTTQFLRNPEPMEQ